MLAIDPSIQMWVTFAVILAAIVAYAFERIQMEVTSAAVVAALLILFYVAPMAPVDGGQAIGMRQLLAGFADPALVAILALLVIGQGMVQTGALEGAAGLLVRYGASYPKLTILFALITVMATSALLNNTPVVVIFIPILSALSEKLGRTVSLVMIPLSFAAILGGNLTLIGSSTNLLVSGAMESANGMQLGFFDITIPGLVLAGAGFAYITFVAPFLLKDRASMAGEIVGKSGKQFIVEIEVTRNSRLDGLKATAGMFPDLPDLTIRMIQRGEQALLPPYDDITLAPGDELIIATTRQTLTGILAKSPGLLRGVLETEEEESEDDKQKIAKDFMLAETVIAPASRLDGRTLQQFGFHRQTNCIVLGIQRRSRMIRQAMDSIRLEAGDVILVIGKRSDVLGLRNNRDVLLMEWSATDLPSSMQATRALAVFAGVVALASTGLVPITIAAVAGATLMVLGRCLNVRQAARAIDRRVIFIVGAALAMGTALNYTGGAVYLANLMINVVADAPIPVILSAFFLLVALLTNVLSNNATAVLFTPIALSLSSQLGVDPMIFVIAVIFAANCSFATPMSYQTNLLVMGPGHYRFSDFMKVGTPLIFVIWIAYSLFAPWYYGLM